VRYPSPGTIDLAAVEGPRSLVQFLMRLLKQLQSLATAPAIDYDAYLARFQPRGPHDDERTVPRMKLDGPTRNTTRPGSLTS